MGQACLYGGAGHLGEAQGKERQEEMEDVWEERERKRFKGIDKANTKMGMSIIFLPVETKEQEKAS